MPQDYVPKYAAGSREDNIRTGKQVHFTNPKKNNPILIILLLTFAVIVAYFVTPGTGEVSTAITNTARADDGSNIAVSVTVTNNANKYLFNIGVNCVVTNESNISVGYESFAVATYLAPGKSASISKSVPISSEKTETLTIHANPTYQNIPFVKKANE